MPWLWTISVFAALALAGPGQAQEAAAVDSAAAAPAGADSLRQAVEAVAVDSLQPSVVPLDSLSQDLPQPALPPAMVPPAPSTPLPPPAESLRADSLPRRARYAVQPRGFLSTRTLWAVTYLGGGAVLYNLGRDYREKADGLYARYKQAADPAEIESLYQRTTNQDTKGQVCWALGAALAVNGVRLLLTRESEIVSTGSSLQMIAAPRSFQLRVRKWL